MPCFSPFSLYHLVIAATATHASPEKAMDTLVQQVEQQVEQENVQLRAQLQEKLATLAGLNARQLELHAALLEAAALAPGDDAEAFEERAESRGEASESTERAMGAPPTDKKKSPGAGPRRRLAAAGGSGSTGVHVHGGTVHRFDGACAALDGSAPLTVHASESGEAVFERGRDNETLRVPPPLSVHINERCDANRPTAKVKLNATFRRDLALQGTGRLTVQNLDILAELQNLIAPPSSPPADPPPPSPPPPSPPPPTP